MLIVDIDGCVVNNFHRKHLIPQNAHSATCWEAFNSSCANDEPVYPVIEVVKMLSKLHDNLIHFVTSRGETSYHSTFEQLTKYFSGIEFKLYMRPMSDNRHTVDYKRSVFAKMPLSQHSVIIDDHPDIISMVNADFSHVNALLVDSHDCTLQPVNLLVRKLAV